MKPKVGRRVLYQGYDLEVDPSIALITKVSVIPDSPLDLGTPGASPQNEAYYSVSLVVFSPSIPVWQINNILHSDEFAPNKWSWYPHGN